MMLEARMIVPGTSAWSFLCSNRNKNDGKSIFSIDDRLLNQKKKADRWPVPKFEELFGSLVGCKAFITIDLIEERTT